MRHLLPCKVKSGGINELYKMENPTVWYFTMKEPVQADIFEGLHNMTCTFRGTEVKLEIQHLGKERAEDIKSPLA